MSDRITKSLEKLFEKHRIIFWYDGKQEMRSEYETVTIDYVEKLEINNNEFGIKYRILREKPEQKFLLYHEGEQPLDIDNWLLDVLLAHGEFRADKVAMWLAELDLGLEFSDLIENHQGFFSHKERREALKKLLNVNDTAQIIRMKMLSISTRAEPRLDSILEILLSQLAKNVDSSALDLELQTIESHNLKEFFWQQIALDYGYIHENPNLKDFAIALFKSAYYQEINDKNSLNQEAIVFIKRWKDSIRHKEAFETLSEKYSEVLKIETDLQKREIPDILKIDYFRLVEQKIIHDLILSINKKTINGNEALKWIKEREQSHWYNEFEHLYEAIASAIQLIQTQLSTELLMDSLKDGVQKYSSKWYKLDQYYRQFIYHSQQSGQSTMMEGLSTQIENLYVNNFLLPLNNQWQTFIDRSEKWTANPIKSQKDFYSHWVKPYIQKDKKILVIISDALRYEIGEELLNKIRQEDRYEGTIEPALTLLPSYTQLGMAALLPHQELIITDNTSGTVMVDGINSQGLINRSKILENSHDGKATAIKAEELMKLNKIESRALVKENKVIYIYHNYIDTTGDKMASEERVFEAVTDTIEYLITLLKKLTGANATNIIITADHGFLYQHSAIDHSDYTTIDKSLKNNQLLVEETEKRPTSHSPLPTNSLGDEESRDNIESEKEKILYTNRRFILGKNLEEHSSLKTFSSCQIGIKGDMQIQIPKSINRLRKSGSGSRFVHGGASLQEVVIPVIKINKKRQSDIRAVEIEIIRGAVSTITTSQLGITLYQTKPVIEKLQPRTLRIGIYTKTEELISDTHELTFDASSDNPRDREVKISLLLTRKADDFNGQEVILRLDEKIQGTSHYEEYKQLIYTIRRSFTGDFDF